MGIVWLASQAHPGMLGSLDRNCRYKSIATKIHHYSAGIKPNHWPKISPQLGNQTCAPFRDISPKHHS